MHIFIESTLRHSMVIIGLIIGGITFRYLSIGQKIIYTQLWFVIILGAWATIRINNGFYSQPVYSIGNLFLYGIELIYIDYELKAFRKKKLFRILGLLLLMCIPLDWIIVRNLNYQSDALILIHLFLSFFLLFCIVNRPTTNANQLLRWALLIFGLGDIIFVVFRNLITWEANIELGKKMMLMHYAIANLKVLLICISFLTAYFKKKKTHQLQE